MTSTAFVAVEASLHFIVVEKVFLLTAAQSHRHFLTNIEDVLPEFEVCLDASRLFVGGFDIDAITPVVNVYLSIFLRPSKSEGGFPD